MPRAACPWVNPFRLWAHALLTIPGRLEVPTSVPPPARSLFLICELVTWSQALGVAMPVLSDCGASFG